MRTMVIPPDNSAYAAQRGSEVLSVKLDGGSSRTRLDVFGAPFTVDVVWIVDPAGFNYLNAFFRTATIHGSIPFKVAMVLDSATLTQYTAIFVPNTFKLTQQQGLAYYLAAQLEVRPLPVTAAADNTLMNTYETAHGGLIGDV